jgi:hypothetical protein
MQMRKLALYFSIAIMAIAMFLPCAVDVGAANPPATSDKVSPVKANLNIIAVDSSQVGQVVKITVSSNTSKVVAQSAVYIISSDNLTLPFDVKGGLNSNNYADIAAKFGLLIGYTDAQGNISYTFNDNGWYLLVAVKDGYNPGIRKIAIGDISQVKQLAVKLPDSVNIGDSVEIGVYTRGDQKAVIGASVYALKLKMIAPTVSPSTSNRQPDPRVTPSITVKNSTESPKAVAQQMPGIDEIKTKGTLIGTTGADGQIEHTFTDSGIYIIAVIKDGYSAGIVRLNVKGEEQGRLQMKVPGSAAVSENVTITVFDRKNNKPVEGAAIYILKSAAVPPVASTDNATGKPKNSIKPVIANVDENEVIAKGMLVGKTGTGGKIIYSFIEAGRYFIVASKEGYNPELARIEIGSSQTQDYLKLVVPATARVNQEITIKVSSRSNRGESGVTVYLINIKDLPVTENTTAPAAMTKPQVYADYALSDGLLIGTTDENGKLAYTFTEPGRFVLVAIKNGFVPGFGRVNVAVAMNNALSFKMPSRAIVDEEVTINVIEKKGGAGVADADIYAYKISGFADAVGHFFQETFSFGNSAREKYAGGVSEIGEYIGATDNTGALIYSFPEKGSYVLVTFKSGYVPDFGKIEINEAKTAKGR